MPQTPPNSSSNTLFYGDNLAVMREHIADESVREKPRRRSPRVPLVCEICKKTVMLAPSIIAQGRRRCSAKCMAKAYNQGASFVCVGCGKDCPSSPSLSRTRRYCSIECLKAHKKTRIKCEVCGKERAVTPTNIKEGARFCSWECARKILNQPRPIVTCIQCGRECAVPPSRVRQGMKFCSHSCRSIHTITHGAMASPTSIELLLYAALRHFNIEFIEQYPMPQAGTVPDAFIPSLNMAVYADGDYWHSLPKVAERDKRQNAKLKELGYNILRLTETDLKHDAIALIESRLRGQYDLQSKRDYNVVGVPADLVSALDLFRRDAYQFQFWALTLIPAFPAGGEKKKGADAGIDGVLQFRDAAIAGSSLKTHQILVQVKGGHVTVSQLRDLRGTMEREKAAMAFFVCLETLTKPMLAEAVAAGLYKSELRGISYPRLQIRTVEELLNGNNFEYPQREAATWKQAARAQAGSTQAALELD